MGGSVSVSNELPSQLTEEEVKNICGDEYNPLWFKALQNEWGRVSSSDLRTLVESKIEREILLLYFTYCPSGRMKNSAFFAMCRECKLLSKIDFSIQQAEKIFDANLVKHEDVDIRTICYRTFRYHLLPDIAPIKAWTFDKVLRRLSECDSLINTKNEERKARENIEVSNSVDQVDKVTTQDILAGGEKSLGMGALFGLTQHNAVVKIQAITRQKLSRKDTVRRKEIRNLELGNEVIEVHDDDKPNEGDESEIIVKTYFYQLVGQSGEMDKRQFVEFLRSGLVLDTDLTTIDAQFIFKKAKATASNKKSAFKDCVIHQKRLTYPPIRVIALAQAALFKGLSLSKFIQAFAAGLIAPKDTNQDKSQPKSP